MITRAELLSVLVYTPETGVWTWLVDRGRARAGGPAGKINSNGYRVIVYEGVEYRSAVLAWFYMTGEWPKGTVDHENRRRSDDRWLNLRVANGTEQNINRGTPRNNTSGTVGVNWDDNRGKWCVRVQRYGKRRFVGYFNTIEEANRARIAAEK